MYKKMHIIIFIICFIVACRAIDNPPALSRVAPVVTPPINKIAPIIEPRLVLDSFSFQRTLYIDGQLNADCDQYDPTLRRCGSGTEKAFQRIATASAQATPGVLFLIRQGDYQEVLHITQSGTETAYIGYVAYPNETVNLQNVNSFSDGEKYGPIWLDNVSYVLIHQINVRDSVGFGRLLNAHYNIISNSHFSHSRLWNEGRGSSKRGGLYIAFSDYNRIVNNSFYKGTDALSLVHSDHNLVSGNRMDLAGHDLWNIKCGNFNVIRNNEFSNKNQKIGSVFDCEKRTLSWHGNGQFKEHNALLNSTQHNLIDNNIFHNAKHYYSASGGNGIQYAGQHGIIRRNIFYHVNIGIGMTSYKNEARYNYANRIYNNTFHDNWCAAIAISKPLDKMLNNEYRNNIIWNNQGFEGQHCKGNNGKQILLRKRKQQGEYFINNNIASVIDNQVLGIWGEPFSYTLWMYQLGYGWIEFMDNVSRDPAFKNELKNDYRLQKNSAMIDQGSFLTSIMSDSGSGNQLQLADVSYFYDGFSIPGEVGDRIQIEGQKDSAVILKIDPIKQSIIIDKVLSWEKNAGIALHYNGTRPDIGALEY